MNRQMENIDSQQKASVSLFIVIFATLLISVVIISFTRIMLQQQDQATDTDLSNSAYDSALAGVEDAKRALLKYQNLCASGDTIACAKSLDLFNNGKCNDAISILSDITQKDSEVGVVNGTDSVNDAKLNQAYTCVKILLNTPDYLGELLNNKSNIIPLVGEKPFSAVRIEWFSADDVRSNAYKAMIDSQSPWYLPQSFATYQPPIMRSQLIEFSPNSTNLSALDGNVNGSSGSNTLFLYPNLSGLSSLSYTSDSRTVGAKYAQSVGCVRDITAVRYSCAATVSVGSSIDSNVTNAFMRLTALYAKTQYRITLLDSSGQSVNFNTVQPEIDSTGRADNMFRRVKSRVELTDINFPYPEAAVDVTGNFCKKFYVTNDPNDYYNPNDCTP